MVITNPRIKHRKNTIQNLWEFAIFVPTFSPIGVMASSAPRVNSIMPTTRSTAPNRNKSRMLGGTGAMVKLKSSTSPMMGSTAFNASSNFSANFVW